MASTDKATEKSIEKELKELEEQLKEAGNKLRNPPSSVDELLPILDEVDSYLSRVEQSPKESMQKALDPSLKALITDKLFKHSDVDVNVAVASCISEITRITAPEAPYDDDQMKGVFQLIVSSFENLDDDSSRSYSKRIAILETVAKVRSCVVMLDLECDALIIEMFQKFLKSVRSFHQENVVSSMKTIMALVLEESEEIPAELLSPLLACVKKGNEEVLPAARKLGEQVLVSCAGKIKPYLVDAVKSLQTSVDDYWDVVRSICQDAVVDNVDVVDKIKVDVSTPDRPLVGEAAEAAPEKPAGVGPSEVPDSAASNGVADTGKPSSLSNSDTLKGQEIPAIEQAKSTNAAEDVEVDCSTAKKVAKKESKPEQKGKKKVGKHAVKSESKHTAEEKEAEKLPDEQDRSRDALNALDAGESASGDAAAASENKKKNDNQPRSPKAADDASLTASPSGSIDESLFKQVARLKKRKGLAKELAPSTDNVLQKPNEGTSDSKAKPTKRASKKTVNDESPTVSPSVSGSLVDESLSKKAKKKDGSAKELPQSTDDVLEKETEGTSNSKGKPTKRSGKKVPVGTPSQEKTLKTTIKSKKESSAASELEAKSLKQLSKANDEGKSAEGALLKQSEQKNKRRGKVVSEKKLAKSAMEVDDNENISSLKSTVKLVKDELPVDETPKTSSKRKRAAGKALEREEESEGGEEIVGKRVRVWWPEDEAFYKGTIQSYDPTENKHMVSYDDGDEENLDMKAERFELIGSDEDDDDEEEAAKPSSPDASAEMPLKKKAKSEQSTKKEKMDVSPKRGGGASSKSRSKVGRRPGRKGKTIDDDSKTPKKSDDDSAAKTKKPTATPKSGPKAPGKSKTDDAVTPKATKSKEDGTSTAKLSKSKSETGKSATGKSASNAKGVSKPLKSGGKSNANGTGKSKAGSSKVKDSDDESSEDLGEAQETKKEKPASKDSEGKGKKRPRGT